MTATVHDAAATQVPTLVVADWSSRCSACGRATLTGTTHDTAPGLHPDRAGCGAQFVAVALDRDAAGPSEAGAREIAGQLGLPYVGRQT